MKVFGIFFKSTRLQNTCCNHFILRGGGSIAIFIYFLVAICWHESGKYGFYEPFMFWSRFADPGISTIYLFIYLFIYSLNMNMRSQYF